MIVDWQHHWTPEATFEARGGVKGQMTAIKRDGKVSVYLHDNFWDLSRHVADMDEAGIDAIWERVERYVNVWGPKFWGWDTETSPLSKPVREYFDMAGYEGGMNAVKCALTLIKPERLLFGTDYPANFPNDGQGMRRYIDNIRAIARSKEAADNMLGGNACRLLKIEYKNHADRES